MSGSQVPSRQHGCAQGSSKTRKSRTTPSVATFRNFEREAELMNDGGPPDKRLCLSDIFRPPMEVLHRGTWENGREIARTQDKWLLVNVQDNQDFKCQCMNRDVWSDSVIRELLQQHFIMCQVSATSEDGEKFRSFYKAYHLPFVNILDPRTGGAVDTWPCDITKEDARSNLLLFLRKRPTPSAISGECLAEISAKAPDTLSEEEQMRLAIANSLRDTQIEQTINVRLTLKLPDDTTEILAWSENTTIERLICYVRQLHAAPFRLICPAIRTDLLTLTPEITLKAAQLHPSAVVYVHPDE
ncbi:UBX domain-containing protein 7 [Phlebotomus argentipes]|uniref:UBX domain-containing protein 7 n=1 Tax=Phlebotomus argentipes TaxID=94469 RepID=UPI002892B44C|nr:UBX domain-containing protein 7 [Phlebotomus argentipes]